MLHDTMEQPVLLLLLVGDENVFDAGERGAGRERERERDK